MQTFRALLGMVVLCAAVPAGRLQAQIAIVVNRGNLTNDLSLEELRSFFLGERTAFKNRERVELVERPTLRKPFYQAALRMDEDRIERHWIRLVFAGEGSVPPREIADAGELRKFVASHPGAIAFLEAVLVDASVKVVTISGRHPPDPEYPLSDKETTP